MPRSERPADTPHHPSSVLDEGRADPESAFTDPLTGFPNRRHAAVYLEREFARARRGLPVAVVLFDFDSTPVDKGQAGSPADQRALRVLARILAETTRKNNLSARWSDDVFITLLSGSDAEGGLVFAERVRRRVESSDEIPPSLTVSAGVAAHHPGIDSPEALVADAEQALAEARSGEGRNRVRGHGPLLHVDLDELDADDPPPDAASSERLPLGHGSRVLVVEDDEDVRAAVCAFLSDEGFAWTEAADVPAALWALRSEFDVLVTDVRLPGGTGTELVTALKSRWPETQAIVVTGLKDATVAAEALNAGADGYLFKPFGLDELRPHLATAVQRRRRLIGDRQQRRLLSHQARERRDQAERAILKGARALVTAVEVRDPYTQGHSMRVSAYAAVLASAADQGQEVDLDALRLACELHDVGKIGIPDAILNKPGPLSDSEYGEVRQHPLTGRRILEPLLSDESVLAVVASHHERWDGSGYPEGLSGREIPFVARLVAIVDALDAMTSTRAYRTARSWEESVSEIRSSFGIHFDPDLAEAFEAALPALKDLHADLETRPTHPPF